MRVWFIFSRKVNSVESSRLVFYNFHVVNEVVSIKS